MFLKKSYISLLILSSFIIFIKCRKKEDINSSFTTTPYNLSIPENFPEFEVPNDNPLTVEGVKLGRHLFWETKLSGNNSMSCGTCHSPQSAFSDANQYSQGINGDIGKRNSDETTNEQIDTNLVTQDEKNTPSSELNLDEVADIDSGDEVDSDDLNAEDGEPEDKEESS